ncbi:MAG: polyprenyl synthetase family protein [Gammaproteobacteria bacterium]|nr:polyprenyl synthetase family protein [Gammaproteobacteria bacterium]
MSQLNKIFAIVDQELGAMQNLLSTELNSKIPFLYEIVQFAASKGGKKLRPALFFLMAGMLGYQEKENISMALSIELIHTATLMHDDVVDNASLRRGAPSTNQVYGNAFSVLSGDFLYSRAFQLMVACNHMAAMRYMADTTNAMAEGEVLQLMMSHNPDIDTEAYWQIIGLKTAPLFQAGAVVPAMMVEASQELLEVCKTIGTAVGMAFQMTDDILDYCGNSQDTGKVVGHDLYEGRTTLPIILALRSANQEQRAYLRRVITDGKDIDMQKIQDIIEETGAINSAKNMVLREIDRGFKGLEHFSDNPYKVAIKDLLEFIPDRLA